MGIEYARIGRHLRKAREKQKLTQAKVAELLGIAENTYNYMERGKLAPSLKRIIQLCEIYDITPGSVLDDCSEQLIGNTQLPVSEESEEKQALHLLIDRCSDKTAHLLYAIAQATYNIEEQTGKVIDIQDTRKRG